VIRDADVTLMLDESHALVLLWQPHSHTRTGPPPPQGRAVLLTGIDQLEIGYWQDAKGGWLTEWRSVTLPKLIRVHIGFSAASARHAPDIVVAPMRDRWRL